MWRSGALRLARRLLRADAGIKLRCAGAGLTCFAAGGAGLAYAEPKPARSGKSAALQTVSTRTNNIHTDYEFGEGIGAGAYGTIYKGKCKHTGRTVAIKALPRRKETEAMVRAEVTALRRVALHRSIAEIYDFYEAPTVFYIVMEFVDGGELLDHLVDMGPLPERKAASLVQEVGGALALMHAQGLCHSDIKPENVLLTKDGQVRLVDFGLTASKDLDEVLSKKVYGTERRGTLPYLAPEVLRQRSTGLPSDMWALGVVLFMTLGGYHPFDAKGEADLKETTANIRAQEPDFDDPLWEGVSDPAKHLLLGLLCKDPAERLTIEQLLQHPWVTSGGAAAGKALRGRVAGQSDPTAGLRAAVFATILHQQVQESQFWRNRTQRSKQLRKKGSLRARMLDSELLSKAFSEFDNEGKGYITEKDLRRVLGGWGQQEATQAIKTMLEGGATGGDREGSRVTYGNYISMMGLIDKAHTEAGDFIIREGDNAAFFYALLSGEVEVTTSCPRHGEQRVAVLRAGEDGFFGETELLDERQPQYTHSVRCAAEDGCEVLKLAKSDFEAGFLGNGGRKGKGDAACEKRRRLLGFMQMVNPSQPLQLKQDEVVPGFREGAPADKYYILRSGTLRVEQGGVVLGRIEADNGFGESGLLSKRAKRSKTITCDSEECELVSIAAATFLRLTEKSSVLREMMQEDKDQRMAEWAAIRRQESSAGGEQPPASTGAENAQLGEQSPGLAAAAGGPPKKKKRWLGIW